MARENRKWKMEDGRRRTEHGKRIREERRKDEGKTKNERRKDKGMIKGL
jgi:hypothetical protein